MTTTTTTGGFSVGATAKPESKEPVKEQEKGDFSPFDFTAFRGFLLAQADLLTRVCETSLEEEDKSRFEEGNDPDFDRVTATVLGKVEEACLGMAATAKQFREAIEARPKVS